MKYEFTGETKTVNGVTVRQIKRISNGLIGGWIESEKNLDQRGSCFVFGDACVFGNVLVSGNAWVSGDARVFGNALVSGDASVFDNAEVFGDAVITD